LTPNPPASIPDENNAAALLMSVAPLMGHGIGLNTQENIIMKSISIIIITLFGLLSVAMFTVKLHRRPSQAKSPLPSLELANGPMFIMFISPRRAGQSSAIRRLAENAGSPQSNA